MGIFKTEVSTAVGVLYQKLFAGKELLQRRMMFLGKLMMVGQQSIRLYKQDQRAYPLAKAQDK